MLKKTFSLFVSFFCLTLSIQAVGKPKVVVVLVIDQLGIYYLNETPFLSHGFYDLFHNGIVFTQAHQPHAITSTAVGHAGIGTGALPGRSTTVPLGHGIVANSWFDAQNNEIEPNSTDARFMNLPTLNKSFLAANPHNKAVAITVKTRSVLGMVGGDAPSIWLGKDQFITNSSDPAIKKILRRFNTNYPLMHHQALTWIPAYEDQRFYQLPDIDNYDYAGEPSLIKQLSTRGKKMKRDSYFSTLFKLPQSNKLLLDLATKYIKKTVPTLDDGTLLVWISLGSLDKMGHVYGPQSREAIDTLYHLDKQIQEFMHNLKTILPPQETLLILTADHGIIPIPELAKKRHPEAMRLSAPTITLNINQAVQKAFGLPNIIAKIESPFIYLDMGTLNTLDKAKQQAVVNRVIEEFAKIPGINNVYRSDELSKIKPMEGSVEWLMQNQLFPGRNGQLMLRLKPYVILTEYRRGTKHVSPYDTTTHVPLVWYEPGVYEHKTINQRVWVPQFNATLAAVLGVPPASVQSLKPLPGILDATNVREPSGSRAQTKKFEQLRVKALALQSLARNVP